jgi:hypothetical protein
MRTMLIPIGKPINDAVTKINELGLSKHLIQFILYGRLVTHAVLRTENYITYEYVCQKTGQKPVPREEY